MSECPRLARRGHLAEGGWPGSLQTAVLDRGPSSLVLCQSFPSFWGSESPVVAGVCPPGMLCFHGWCWPVSRSLQPGPGVHQPSRSCSEPLLAAQAVGRLLGECSSEPAVGRLCQHVQIFHGGPGHSFWGASLPLHFQVLGAMSLPGL